MLTKIILNTTAKMKKTKASRACMSGLDIIKILIAR